MTDSQPPLTRRELRELRARREAELQSRTATQAATAPGDTPGASARPDDVAAQHPHADEATRRERHRPDADPSPGTLFLPKVAPAPPKATESAAPAAKSAALSEPETIPQARPAPAAQSQPAEQPKPAAPATPAAPVLPTPPADSASSPAEQSDDAPSPAPAPSRHVSRRLERLRRQAEAAGLGHEPGTPVPGAADAGGQPGQSRQQPKPAASDAPASPVEAPVVPAQERPTAAPAPSALERVAQQQSQAAAREQASPQAPSASASATAPAAPAEPAETESSAHGTSHRRREERPSHHSSDVQRALGQSPTLEAAQAEIEAMAAAREAALRRALVRRNPAPPAESFSDALGLPDESVDPPSRAEDHNAKNSWPVETPVRESTSLPGLVPPPVQRDPEPAAPADGPAPSFSDLLGIPSAPPLQQKRPSRGGRRSKPGTDPVQDKAAQKRLENTGLIAPVTQEVSVVLPTAPSRQGATPDLNGVPEGAMPVAAQRAHGLDPLEYKSSGVQRTRWSLVVVLGSVVVAVTAIIVALNL